MTSYNSTARRPFAKGGRTGFSKGSERKINKKHKPYEKSRRVSRETIREAVKDIQGDKSTHGKSHSLESSRKDAAKRLTKLIKKQVHFPTEKKIKKNYPERDKGWGGKHSRKVEQN